MTGLSGPPPDQRPEPPGRRTPWGVRTDPARRSARRRDTAGATPRRTVLSALVDHDPGVLAEVSGLFARRQFDLESLAVGPAADPSLARMTMVVTEPGVEQVRKQVGKLLPVHEVGDLAPDATRRELALVKVGGDHPDRVAAVADAYGGRAVDAAPGAVTVEVTGRRRGVDAAIRAFERFDVREVVRTGTAALARGEEGTP